MQHNSQRGNRLKGNKLKKEEDAKYFLDAKEIIIIDDSAGAKAMSSNDDSLGTKGMSSTDDSWVPERYFLLSCFVGKFLFIINLCGDTCL